MHYYNHHIGDFQRDTASLSDADTLAYLRLLWMYYDTEQPLPNDTKKLAFRIGSNSDAVQMLLDTFFTLENDVWTHRRCDAELAKFHEKSDRARNANKIRWGSKMDIKSDPNKIPTNNQEPITNKTTNTLPRPDDISEELWKDFKKLRDKKKAPITELVLTKIRAEAKNAGITLSQAMEEMCVRGWTAFKADWVKSKNKPSSDFDEMLRRAK